MIDKQGLLQPVELFVGLSDSALDRFAQVINRKSYLRGDTIYKEDNLGDNLYIIKRGEIKLSRIIREAEEQTLVQLGDGQYFGAISFLDGGRHTASAKAMGDSEVFTLSREDFKRIAQQDPAAGIKVLQNISKSLCNYMRLINGKFMDMIQYVSLDR